MPLKNKVSNESFHITLAAMKAWFGAQLGGACLLTVFSPNSVLSINLMSNVSGKYIILDV